MAEIFINRRGGASSLNYRVVGGAEQPAAPKENTIWVQTDVPIPNHAFRMAAPSAPVEGSVWITSGATGTVRFNALKKNALEVYPLYAKQYLSGVWVTKPAALFTQGSWVDLSSMLYLYKAGDRCENVTGGLTAAAKKLDSGSDTTAKAPAITYNGANYKLSQSASSEGIVHTKNKIDLTDFKTLRVKAVFAGKGNTWFQKVYVWNGIGTYGSSNAAASWGPTNQSTSVQNVSIDVSSLKGEYNIGFYLRTSGTAGDYYIQVSEMWLEKE